LVTIFASASNGGGSPGFQWYKNGALDPSYTGSSYGPYAPADGDYIYCIMTSTAPCAAPLTARSNVTTIHLGGLAGAVNTIVMGARAQYFIELASWSIPSPTPRGYVVKINTINSFTDIPNGTIPAYNRVYTGSGEQAVYAGRANGPVTVLNLHPATNYYFKVYPYSCSDIIYQNGGGTTNPTFFTTTSGVGIDEPVSASTWSIYPNPSQGEFSISGDQNIKHLAIYSVEGKLLFEKDASGNDITLKIEIPSGLYLMEITGEKGSVIKKLNINN
jgi:hypothetical protein